jgi:UDP-N-acetylmuramoylalanine-D-glutamate ligase
VPVKAPADCETHGRSADPIRNRRTLDEGKPDLVVAFPGGRGTAHMVSQARAAGVRVIEVMA